MTIDPARPVPPAAPGRRRQTRPAIDHNLGRATAEHIRELGRQLHRLRNDLVAAVTAYDLSGHWAASGAASCGQWLANELGVSTGTAREWLRVGHALRALDRVAEAFDDERLSYTKVRELTRLAVDHPDHQAELVGIAERCTANDLGRALAEWSAQFEDPDVRDRRHHRQRGATFRTEHDGCRVMTLRLPPLPMARIEAAIDAEVTTTKRGENVPAGTSSPLSEVVRPTLAQQRADALVGLVTNGGAAVTTEVILHVRGDGCSLDDGTPVSDTVVERIAPASFLRAMIHNAERRPINVSERHRHPTDRQRRLVKERDRTCTDCGGTAFLQAHHDPPYEVSKRTVVEELVLKCNSCHRRIHGGGNGPG